MQQSISYSASPVSSVPLLDVNRGNSELRSEILDAIAKVVDSGRFLHGPECGELECAVAGISQTKHAIGCASGTDALLLALMALDLEPGDEVIVPSYTFFATASCVWRLGLKIVFADIDPRTFNLDPKAVQAAITPRTRAIIPVHLFGQCCQMDLLCKIGREHNIAIIEDTAQSIGAAYHGRAAGSWGEMGCTSFYPTKNLGGMGDGGMLTTNDDTLADRLKLYANHGMRPRYYHQVVGINSRLDTIQAAILNVKIAHLASYVAARQANAARYIELFDEFKVPGEVVLPYQDSHGFHVWNQYGVLVTNGRRDALKSHLAERKIGAEIYYPVPLHQQRCFAGLCEEGTLPVTEQTSLEMLNLPIYPELTVDEQVAVVRGISQYYASGAALKAA